MITKQVIENCINDIHEITKVDMAVVDTENILIASTTDAALPSEKVIKDFLESEADSQIVTGHNLFKAKRDEETEYVLMTFGDRSDGYVMGKIAIKQLEQLLVAYREQFDHASFIQNLLLDNLLLVDIYNKAKKLNMEATSRRIVFAIEVDRNKQSEAMAAIKGVYAKKSDDYCIAVDENSVILVHTLDEDETAEDMQSIAESLEDTMSTELMVKAYISYGMIVSELKQLSKSYKEAKMAMEVGKIFFADRNINSYDDLGIGRLIYQLPVNLCKLYVEEVFGENTPDKIDEEIIQTAQSFLDNSLNVSETSRQRYIHRNTLVYRLDKLKEKIGLDVRNFDDALTFKIAMMVDSYIKNMDNLN